MWPFILTFNTRFYICHYSILAGRKMNTNTQIFNVTLKFAFKYEEILDKLNPLLAKDI